MFFLKSSQGGLPSSHLVSEYPLRCVSSEHSRLAFTSRLIMQISARVPLPFLEARDQSRNITAISSSIDTYLGSIRRGIDNVIQRGCQLLLLIVLIMKLARGRNTYFHSRTWCWPTFGWGLQRQIPMHAQFVLFAATPATTAVHLLCRLIWLIMLVCNMVYYSLDVFALLINRLMVLGRSQVVFA